jgi:hypothetical protein
MIPKFGQTCRRSGLSPFTGIVDAITIASTCTIPHASSTSKNLRKTMGRTVEIQKRCQKHRINPMTLGTKKSKQSNVASS